MFFLTSIFLGIVAGICEFLPISGSGHLAILHNIFGVTELSPFFNFTLHLALLAAIFVTYRPEIVSVWHNRRNRGSQSGRRHRKSEKARNDRRIYVYILLGTLPLLPALLLRSLAGRLSLSTLFVAIMLFANGFLIFYADHHGRLEKAENRITILDALLVGIGQLLAIFPGVSRTGTTISIGRLCGFPKKFAVTFSFLLRVPSLIVCSCIYLIEAFRAGIDVSQIPACLLGSVLAMVAGIFALRFLRWMNAHNGFSAFAYYCWGAGIVSLLLSLIS